MPEKIGEYRILALLGEGGMGVVWEAEQQKPHRRVALKVMRQGHLADAHHARMFHREAETLGRLKHQNIASIYESGRTEDGHDFFAMELVEGETLETWLAGRTQRMSPEELELRLRLFRIMCEAVHYAHQRGVIHRDLKPSNIIITDPKTNAGNAKALPIPIIKILDFGLARITEVDGLGGSLLTEVGMIRGTLSYMSPEQARGDSRATDVRTDVYSLGVLLYEMVCGRRPYDVLAIPLPEALRIICEDSPRSLSATWNGVKRLDLDIETIVGKALAKEPERRYGSASAFAEDIERFLASQPITARPPSRAYQIRKFVIRNKVVVAAGATIVIALLVGAGGFAWQAGIARYQRDRAVAAEGEVRSQLAMAKEERDRAIKAEDEARKQAGIASQQRDRAFMAEGVTKKRAAELEQVSKFQTEMLGQVDPTQAGKLLAEDVNARFMGALIKTSVDPGDRSLQAEAFAKQWQRVNATDAARELIDRAILKPGAIAIDKQFKDQPVLYATLSQVLADRYSGMGLYDVALPLQQRALAIRRRVLGQEHLDTLISINALGELLRTQGKLTEAEGYFREGLEKGRRALGGNHPVTLASLNVMCGLLLDQGKPGQAEPYCREALQKRRRVLGEEHPDTVESISNMGVLLRAQGKLGEAAPYYREALHKRRRVLGEEHRNTLGSINDMGVLLWAQGQLGEAVPYFREALEKSRRLLGEEHPDTLSSINNMGVLLRTQGKPTEAEPYFREALAKNRRVLGEEHPDTLKSISGMGSLLKQQNNLEGAEPYFREGLEKSRRLLGEEHPDTLRLVGNMGALLVLQCKHAEAADLLAAAMPATRKAFVGANAFNIARILMILGKAQVGLGQHVAAEKNLLEAHAIFVQSQGPSPKDTKDCMQAIVNLYAAWQVAEPSRAYEVKATEWQRKLHEMEAAQPFPTEAKK